MIVMNFKKFKKKNECRSLLIEGPVLREKHASFFNEISLQLDGIKYEEWESEALFFLFLKPTMDLRFLRPEKIEEYSKSVISQP